jgi:mono/diheme cytochrome c family protein
MTRWFLTIGLLVLFASSARAEDAASSTLFERDIRPILKTNCFQCHGEAGEKKGGLDLRLQRLMLAGGDSGPAIVPGKPEESYLVERLQSGEMPPEDKKNLTPEEVERIVEWIKRGAPTARSEPENPDAVPAYTDEELAFWAFQPIRSAPLPHVQRADLVATPIDAFVLQKLEAQGLTFAPEADRHTLIRRASADLWGLPPTPEEVAAFVADDKPDAYERLIDRLLASPRYGERWARHWLDVAGYADSEGYSDEDRVRPSAFRYRDYVIRALNNDKPFDIFIQEQLAGDEMVSPTEILISSFWLFLFLGFLFLVLVV